MTLEELLQIIKNKKENALYQYYNELKSFRLQNVELKGAIDTYADLICLIESELNKEKK